MLASSLVYSSTRPMSHRSAFGTRLVPLCAGLALAGCAATPPIPRYVPPPAAPSAQLVMRGSVQAGESYGVYLFRDAQACVGLQQVGIGNAVANPATATIAAAGLSTAEIVLMKTNKSLCRVRTSFEPTAGHKYLITVNSLPNGCSARLLDATDPHKIVPEPTLRRRDVGGQLCMPIAQTSTVAEASSRAQTNSEADLPIPSAPAAIGKAPAVSESDLGGLVKK